MTTTQPPQGYSIDDDDDGTTNLSPPPHLPANPAPASPPAPAPVTPSATAASPVTQTEGTPPLPTRPEENVHHTTTDPPTDPTNNADDFSHPQVAALHAIFPDFDASLL